ncbi:acyl carrier protein [Streptomyces sp. BK208]|uniref:acyl carrier protein n=1 Tax=Streptomyces sp. BK208 TaxID=2512150 RepID=UPI0014151451|nr:acyl carrier protein [Streptomyces sp. BK208]
MSEQATLDLLAQILEQKFGVPRDKVALGTNLEEIGLDSLALIEVSLTLGKRLGRQLPTEDMDSSGTVSKLVELVRTEMERPDGPTT